MGITQLGWWCAWELRQEGHEFQASLSYISKQQKKGVISEMRKETYEDAIHFVCSETEHMFLLILLTILTKFFSFSFNLNF
jgi:hypothetical protein